MNNGGDAAEQVVRLSLEGFEVAAKLTGTAAKELTVLLINGFTQCHACVVQTTTRYAGVHKKLYKKITNRITIRMFKSIVKKKGDFNGK